MQPNRCSSARASARSALRQPYYTDNNMHDLQTERFYTAKMINGMDAAADGPINYSDLQRYHDHVRSLRADGGTDRGPRR